MSDKSFPSMVYKTYYYNLPKYVQNNPKRLISDKKNWTKISGTFKAVGREKYIALRSLNKNFVVAQVDDNPEQRDEVVYYVDDLLVKEIPEDFIETDTIPNKIIAGISLTLYNVFFEYRKAVILPASFTELNILVEYLVENPSKTIQITGHTDNTGKEPDNRCFPKTAPAQLPII